MKRHCLALDLNNDPQLISEYEKYHKNVWPEILQSLRAAGINEMQIYRLENRLFMIIDADDSFSFEQKNEMDAANPKVQEWEQLMWKFQSPIPGGKPGEKWRVMDKIFSSKEQ